MPVFFLRYGMMMVIGCCEPTIISAPASVPLAHFNGGPCEDDHLNPLTVPGSRSRLAKSSITDPRPARSAASFEFRSVRFTPSSVDGKSAMDATLATIDPY